MDKKEFAVLASAIKTYFPKEKILPNKESIELWYRELNDIPYEVAQLALRKWVALNKWSPTIADIREQSLIVIKGKTPSWSEAWEECQKLIHKYGSWEPQKALAEMSELTRMVVTELGYTQLCRSDNITADRANFRMIYEEKTEKQFEDDICAVVNELIATHRKELGNDIKRISFSNTEA